MKIWLVVTYLSFHGNLLVNKYEMNSMADCIGKSKEMQKQVRVGKVSTVCWKNR